VVGDTLNSRAIFAIFGFFLNKAVAKALLIWDSLKLEDLGMLCGFKQ
jgi:hypothetical protein